MVGSGSLYCFFHSYGFRLACAGSEIGDVDRSTRKLLSRRLTTSSTTHLDDGRFRVGTIVAMIDALNSLIAEFLPVCSSGCMPVK